MCELDKPRCDLTEHKRFAGLKLEIQIRSVLQHAWAEIEHDLGYHTEGAVPRDARRRFSRLAGLLELADKEFKEIRGDLADYKKAVDEDPITNAGIDRDSMLAFIRTAPQVKDLDEHIAPWFNDGLDEMSPPAAGYFVELLQGIGLTSMAELAEVLTKNAETVRRFADHFLGDNALERSATRGVSLFYLWYVLLAGQNDQAGLINAIRKRHLSPGTPAEIAADVRAAYEAATRTS